MPQMLFQTTLSEDFGTMGTYRIPRTFARCHFYVRGPTASASRKGIEAARALDEDGLRKRIALQRMSAAASRYYRADLGQLDECMQRIFQAYMSWVTC